MYFVIGIIFACIGLLMLLKPQIIYSLVESWKNNLSGEPSRLYLFSTRFGGVIFLLVGIAAVITQFIL